jgi:hypothetical protein
VPTLGHAPGVDPSRGRGPRNQHPENAGQPVIADSLVTIETMSATIQVDRISVSELAPALAAAWSHETSVDPDQWSEENPTLGQCAVTALIVQDYLGGVLCRGEVGSVSHYWNVLSSGEEIDLTRSQFGTDVVIRHSEPRAREYVLADTATRRRYELLSSRVKRELDQLR